MNSFVLAQTTRSAKESTEGLLPEPSQMPTATAGQNTTAFPTDNVVTPEHYMIGPGDVLVVQIVGVASVEIPVTVSPESSILLPRLGEISLVGKTLAQAKAEIQRLVQSRNSLNRASVALSRPRSVYVRITGNVRVPALYTVPASMKVSTAVGLANPPVQPTAPATTRRDASADDLASALAGKRQFIASFAARNTKVLHRNGVTEVSDVIRANVLNDPAADPHVREGDEIYVPFEAESSGMLSVAGAVQRPSVLPWRKGDKLSFLLKAGFGLTDVADSAAIVVTEGVVAGGNGSTTVSLRDVLSGTADRDLSSGVSVIVKEKTAARQAMVTVLGEVATPGVYPMSDDGIKLKAAIERAGGFTKEAHLPASYVTRREMLASSLGAVNPALEAFRDAQYSTLTAEDTARFNLDASLKRPMVACDVAAAFSTRPNADSNNITLHDGDVIVIARNPRNVFVFGQVNKPGYIEFTSDKTPEQYIQSAGGYAIGADAKKTRIIKAGSKLWLEPKNAQGEIVKMDAGDQLYIPRIPDMVNDFAFKKAQVELQREGNELQRRNIELQESNRVWSVVGAIVGFLATVANLLIVGIAQGVIKF